MSRQELENWASRPLRFETVEQRLVLSADPLAALTLPGALVGYEHHALDLQQQVGEIAPQLGTVNATTGVSYVHNNYGFTGAGQTVAVIDSGIAYDHYNLGRGYGVNYRVVGGWDFAENDANPYDDAPAGFHGTHVAGIIGSDHTTNTGVAPDVDLVALRVFNDSGQGNFAWVESALQWVIANRNTFENPITTINMSLGVPAMNGTAIPNWAMLEDELATLSGMGIFVAVSAGNDFTQFNRQGLSYPAVSQYVVPVASANDAGTAMSSFSQRDDHVLVAPGETIVSTVPDALFSFNGVANDWASASGTSMASPYVAGASVLVREAYWSIGVSNVNQDMIYDVLFDTASLIYDPITAASYRFIDVDAAIEFILSSNNEDEATTPQPPPTPPPPPPPPTIELGNVDARQVLDISVGGDVWYQVTAANSGTFTARAVSAGQQNIDVQIYNEAKQLLVDGLNVAGFARADAQVSAGQTLYVRLTGSSPDTDLTLANLVSQNGASVVVSGTAANDWFGFTAGAQHSVIAGGICYTFSAATTSSFTFNAGGGYDSLQFTGTAGSETAQLQSTSGTIVGQNFLVSATQTERIVLNSGGGSDSAFLFGTAASETLTTRPQSVVFSGNGFAREANGYQSVTVYGGAGYDQASMYDSAGDDFYWASPTWSQMQGTTFLHIAQGFERVQGFSSLGSDRASLNDSAGDDTFTFRIGSAELTGAGYSLAASGFRTVVANASSGLDRANFYDVVAPNRWVTQSAAAVLSNSTFYVVANRFDQINALAVSTLAKANALGNIATPAEFSASDGLTDGLRVSEASIQREQAKALFFQSLEAGPRAFRAEAALAHGQAISSTDKRSHISDTPEPTASAVVFDENVMASPVAAQPSARLGLSPDGQPTNGTAYAGRSPSPADEFSAIDYLYFTLSEGV